MDAERKRIADAVTAAQSALVRAHFKGTSIQFVDALVAFARAVREDERWELMARSEANPT
jgi:Xaa-Pro aminopeptidase